MRRYIYFHFRNTVINIDSKTHWCRMSGQKRKRKSPKMSLMYSRHSWNSRDGFPNTSSCEDVDYRNRESVKVEQNDNSCEEPQQSSSYPGAAGIHADEKRFVCTYCNKGFRHLGNLTTHQRTHTREKPFECGVCGKKFSHKCNLTDHLRTHTNDPFACDQCDYTCAWKGNLKKHIRTHTGEKPFTCDVCDQSFTTSSNLKQHQYKHTGVKPFACGLCLARFVSNPHLKRHERTHSNDEKQFQSQFNGSSL